MTTTMSSTRHQPVEIWLQVVNKEKSGGETVHFRHLQLEAPSYSIRIGRGSRSGSKDLYPAHENAWFDSRVMSREHAILKAHPNSKSVTIEDTRSMHGTYVDNVKLPNFQPKVLYNGDQIVFGAEVSRGPDTFPALEINMHYTFNGDRDGQEPLTPIKNLLPSSPNSFSVPGYDSEDEYSEADVKIDPTVRDEAIPESDISNDGSFISDNDESAQGSWNKTYCNMFPAAQKASQELHKQTKTNPADVIIWSKCGDGSEGGHMNGNIASGDVSAARALAENDTSASHQPNMQSNTTAQPTAEPVIRHTYPSSILGDPQSESDYGDDISADLFDDDYDQDYQGARQPETSSISSPSPNVTTLPSKIQLAAHQMLAKEAVKPISPGSSCQPTSAPRPPSPSDAAMPKAKETNDLIFPNTPEQQQQHQKVWSMSSQALSSSYPTYMPAPSQDPYLRSYGYTPGPDGYAVQDTYPNPYYPLDVYPPCYDAPAVTWLGGAPRPLAKPIVPARKILEPEPAPAPAPASPFVTIKTAPRVAIKDLVDAPESLEGSSTEYRKKVFSKVYTPRAAIFPTHSGTKRKADQVLEDSISGSAFLSSAKAESIAGPSLSQDQQDAQLVDALTSMISSESQTDLLKPVEKSEDVLPTSSVLADERPKKKARSNIYQQAAGAAGWMAVGAVGAVAALVALPADFFV